jgi:predicted transglutaminase-like cysteine proteinase
MLEHLPAAPWLIELYGVNSSFNSFAYRSDRALWKRPDYWASPVEFLDQRAGDCEDFAIAKYFALRALGIPDDQILIAHVFDLTVNASHLILLYGRPGAPDLALDNRTSLILRLGQHENSVPVYGFNATGAFLLSAAAQPRIRSQRQIA